MFRASIHERKPSLVYCRNEGYIKELMKYIEDGVKQGLLENRRLNTAQTKMRRLFPASRESQNPALEFTFPKKTYLKCSTDWE